MKYAKIEQHLIKYLNAKPDERNIIIFKSSNIFESGRGGMTKQIRSMRQSLSTYLQIGLKSGPITVGDFKISIYAPIVPIRYVATRME